MPAELNALTARLERLEQDNAQLAARVNSVETHSRRERRNLRVQATLAFVAFLLAVFVSPGNRAAIAQGYGVTLASLNTRLIAVEAKTQFQSADATAKSTTFSACNVIVNDGGGNTSTIVTNAAGDGIGNLIVGYNSLKGVGGLNVRTGSHNLIVGDLNNYSSYGGLVAGIFNTVSGSYSSVTGGNVNTASGPASSVSGGRFNTSNNEYACVTGGSNNTASNYAATVSGGYGRNATGFYDWVAGGLFQDF